MRKWFIFIILIASNYFFFYGINYANKVIDENKFVIRLFGDDEETLDNQEEQVTREDHSKDTEFKGETIEKIGEKMDKVFVKTDLEGKGSYISEVSVHKGISPYLIGGIILESTNCRNECSVLMRQCNNVFEVKGGPGCFGGSYKKYLTVEEGINDLVNMIYNKVDTEELQNPYKLFKLYGKNETWAYKVSNYMDLLKRG